MRSFDLRGKISAALLCLSVGPFFAGMAQGQTVIANIQVPGFVGPGAVDPIAHKVYLPTGSFVTVIDEKTNKLAGLITLPTNWPAVAVALNPITSRLYVGAENGGLFIVNTRTLATVGSINVNATSMVINLLTNKIFVSDFESNLYVIDGYTNNIETTIPINFIQNIALNPLTGRVYAAQDLFPGEVTVVDGYSNKIVATVAAGGDLSFSVALDLAHDRFYTADQFGTVSVFNGRTNKLETTITVPGQPVDVQFDEVGRKLYVTDVSGNELYVIDTVKDKVTGGVSVGPGAEYATLDEIRGLLYVGTSGSDPNVPTSNVAVVKIR